MIAACAHTHRVQIDPDPFTGCSWGQPDTTFLGGPQTCGPCPPLKEAFSGGVGNGTLVTLQGAAPATVYQSCLRRLYVGSVAYGGQEGPGLRNLTFKAHAAGAPADQAAVSAAQVEWVVDEGGSRCSDALPRGPMIHYGTTSPDEPPPTPVYQAGCLVTDASAPGPCAPTGYYTLLQPSIAVSWMTPAAGGDSNNESYVQYASVTLDWKRLQGVQAKDQDRFWVAPLPGGNASSPCPGLYVYELFSTGEPPYAGAFQGIIIAGASSPEVYTACLRRVYYYNLAAEGRLAAANATGAAAGGNTAASGAASAAAVTPGERLFETTVFSSQTSGL